MMIQTFFTKHQINTISFLLFMLLSCLGTLQYKISSKITAVLFIISLIYVFVNYKKIQIPQIVKLYFICCCGYVFSIMISGYFYNEKPFGIGFDRAVKVIFAVCFLIYLLKLNFSLQRYLYILNLSALTMAFLGLYQKYILLHPYPFHEYVNKIPAATIMSIFTIISLCTFIEQLLDSKKNNLLLILAFFSFILGCYVMVLTQTRGIFIGLPVVISYLIFIYRQHISKKIFAIITIFLLTLSCLFMTTETANRIKKAFLLLNEQTTTLTCNPLSSQETSAALRLMYWKMALIGIKEQPFIGHGSGNFMQFIPSNNIEGCDASKDRYGYHTHNDFLNTLFNYGLIGFFFFIGMLLLPLIYCWQKTTGPNKGVAVIGVTSIIQYICCQLTDVPFWNKETLIFYLIIVCIFFAALSKEKRSN